MSKWLVYTGFALDGMGVVLLGPLLPRLESAWGLGDAEAGMLLGAMFFGMTAGTILVLPGRRRAMVAGAACSSGGLLALAALLTWRLEQGALIALATAILFVYGFGLGQAITTLNLAAGAQPEGRSARLAFGNAAWSAGAILSPLIVAVALRGSRPGLWLAGLSLLFPLVWIPGTVPIGSVVARPAPALRQAALPIVLVFCVLMFLYGSVESCLSSWVTTFAGRDAHARAAVSPLSVSAFWFGVASGHMLAGVFLRRLSERQSLLLLVGGASLASLGLILSQSMIAVSLLAALCGACIGPAFASIVSGVLGHGASPRQTGIVLAMCGLGATVMPFLLGLVSQEADSLREAFIVPGICLISMFLIALFLVHSSEVDVPAVG